MLALLRLEVVSSVRTDLGKPDDLPGVLGDEDRRTRRQVGESGPPRLDLRLWVQRRECSVVDEPGVGDLPRSHPDAAYRLGICGSCGPDAPHVGREYAR